MHTRSEEVTTVAVALAPLAAALACGGAHDLSNGLLAGLLLLALIITARSTRRPHAIGCVAGLVAATIGLSLLHLLPLPQAVHEFLAPGAMQVFRISRLDEALYLPLSLDAPATAGQLYLLVACFAAALLGRRMFRHRAQRQLLLECIGSAGVVLAALGLLHHMAGLSRPYGSFGTPLNPVVTSFINANHQAAFFGLSALCCLGASIGSRRSRRPLFAAGAVACGAGLFLSGSLGASFAFCISLVVVGVALGTRQQRSLRPTLGVFTAALIACVFLGLAMRRPLAQQIAAWDEAGDTQKFAFWRAVPDMLAAFPFGSGRGAFAAAYGRYSMTPLERSTAYLENEWLQLLVDFGPLFGGVLILGGVFAVLRVARQIPAHPNFAVVTGVMVFLGVQNMVDFSLRLSAIALPATLLLSAFSRRRGSGKTRRPRQARRSPGPLGLYGLPVAGVVVLLLATANTTGKGLAEDALRLRAVLANEPQDTQDPQYMEFAKEVIARHPAAYIIPLLLGDHELRRPRRARQALVWLNTARLLAPIEADSHRLSALALLRLGQTPQAIREYAVFCQLRPYRATNAVDELYALTKSAENVVRLGRLAPAARLAAAHLLTVNAHADRALALLGGIDTLRDEVYPEPIESGIGALIALDRLAQASSLSRRLRHRWSSRPSGYLLGARGLELSDESLAAIRMLDSGLARATSTDRIMEMKARILCATAGPSACTAAAKNVLDQVSHGPMAARGHILLGRVASSQRHFGLALTHYRRAKKADPKTLAHRLALAEALARIGQVHEALEELDSAESYIGPSWTLSQVRQKLQRALSLKGP